MRGQNNSRSISEAASVFAWRSPYDANGNANLHVRATFKEARLYDEEIPISFRLQIKKAELHLVDPAWFNQRLNRENGV